MKTFSVLIILLGLLTACQNDSDYFLGAYEVHTTVKLSSCPEQNLTGFTEPLVLPTGTIPEQTSHTHWQLHRIAITGTGAESVLLKIMPLPHQADAVLEVIGTLDQDSLHVESRHALHVDTHELTRVIVIAAMLDADQIAGSIHTILSSPALSVVSCDVYEEFSGTRTAK